MKHRLRLLSVVLVLAFAVSVFAGCSGKTAENSQKVDESKEVTKTEQTKAVEPKKAVSLKMWGGVPAVNGPDEACENFNKLFADKKITVSYERYVNDDAGNLKLDTALLSGQDVDLFYSHGMNRHQKRVEGNMALDLTEILAGDNFDMVKNFGEIVKEYYVNDKPYCIPTYAYEDYLLINKDMFDQNNIPIPASWTIDEFREIAKKLTKGEETDKIYGAMFTTGDTKILPISPAATKLGADLMYKDGKDSETDFTNPDIKKSMQIFVDMMLVDKSMVSHVDIVTSKLTPTNLFTSGKVAITNAYWIVRDIKDREKYPHKFVTAFVPMPQLDGSQEKYYTNGGLGDYISISSKAKNIKEAWEFLKWYATGGMQPLVPHGRVPAYLGVDKESVAKALMVGYEELFDVNTYMEVVLGKNDEYQIQKVKTKLPEIRAVADEEFELAMIGKKTVDQALNDCKKRSDDILAKK